MPVDWQAMAAATDNIVNSAFGLDIDLLPQAPQMTAGKADPYKVGPSDGTPDEDRSSRAVRGIYVSKQTALDKFPGMMATDTVADMYVSLKSADIGDLRQKDRVVVHNPPKPWADPFSGELTYITPGDTGRSLLHLVMIKTGHSVRSSQEVGAPTQSATVEHE
jgi:hypothetical protein